MSVNAICLLSILFLITNISSAEDDPFAKWLEELKIEAIEKGISESTLDSALSGLSPIPRVIELDRHQPEFKLDFWTYQTKVVSEWRIRRGRELLAKHRELLKDVEAKYGVPPRFLVAFWGIETNFGKTTGSFPVISSVATLAYDPRRSSFFRRELLNALTIVDEGHIKAGDMMGSWAGAMGQLQFMPSTFVRYAMDADGDGRKDIWNTMPDIMESASNFLSQSGWQRGVTWGRQVRLPESFDTTQAGLETVKPLAQWQALGVRKIDGSDLPSATMNASIVLPAKQESPAFLAYTNYRVIMRWNRSHYYAVAVGHLADRLIGLGALKSRRPAE
jgi:membrane-bound lytic murein transglycosylase B